MTVLMLKPYISKLQTGVEQLSEARCQIKCDSIANKNYIIYGGFAF